jgi:hypothetical protein
MNNRVDKTTLLNILARWDRFIKRKVHIIACGGTALTLLNVKASTKDIDLLIPDPNEYKYLLATLVDLGYKQETGTGWRKDQGFVFDLFVSKTIFTTELLESPLQAGNRIPYKDFSSIRLSILNYYDLIITKLFRSAPVDVDDCLTLIREKSSEINIEKLKLRFYETSSYDISDEKNRKNFKSFYEALMAERNQNG